MAIEYIIDMDCEVKKKLTLEGMVSMIKQRANLWVYFNHMRKEGKTDEEIAKSTITHHFKTPDGIQVTEQKVSDLIESARVLNNYIAYCKKCAIYATSKGASACRKGTIEDEEDGFNCYGMINYPISRKAEDWLVEMSRNALAKGVPDSIMLTYIPDQKISGEPLKSNRASDAEGTFYELKKPLEIALSKGLFTKKTVDTDQILFMLCGFGKMERVQMMTLLHFTGAFTSTAERPRIGVNHVALEMEDKNGKGRWWTFSLAINESDDKSIRQFKRYFWALYNACSLNQDVRVSM
jgi:hypothetical protein